MKLNKTSTKTINGFEVRAYECSVDNSDSLQILQEIVADKIKKMRIHRNIDQLLPYSPPNLKIGLTQQLQKAIAEISLPKEHSIIAFDVRRSRVTEFMSQVLLEHDFGCIFLDEFDKRINLDFHEADKHVSGIDVTGYKHDHDGFKFVACEVKASANNTPGSKTSKSLYEDVTKTMSDDTRLLREVLDITFKLDPNNKEFEEVLIFLLSLIDNKDSQTFLKDKITIIPFYLRNYSDKLQNVRWEKEFDFYDINQINKYQVVGYLWSFEHDINELTKAIYAKALVPDNDV